MTKLDKIVTLRTLEEAHKHNHKDANEVTSECTCAFGLVWRMVNTEIEKPQVSGRLY